MECRRELRRIFSRYTSALEIILRKCEAFVTRIQDMLEDSAERLVKVVSLVPGTFFNAVLLFLGRLFKRNRRRDRSSHISVAFLCGSRDATLMWEEQIWALD